MSVCNFHLTTDEIVIVTDTVGYAGDAPAQFSRKVAINHAAGLVVSVRGPVRVGNMIDDLVRRARTRAHAEELITAALVNVEDRFPEAEKAGCEPTLFGWDEDGPFVVRFKKWPSQPAERLVYGSGVYLAPTLGAQQYPERLSDEQWTRIALVQQALVKKHGLMMCIGGQVERTRITAGGIALDVLADYPDRAETEAAVAAWQAERFGVQELAA